MVTTSAFLLYDTHGNMVATLTKNASGTSWNVGNERSYDVWGGVRSGNATGGPKGRYCANLGHVQDDESGLIYMRARYYEPSAGRFISEDPARNGANWFVYAYNCPANAVDPDGLSALTPGMSMFGMLLGGSFTLGLGLAYLSAAMALDSTGAFIHHSMMAAMASGVILGFGFVGLSSSIDGDPIHNGRVGVATAAVNTLLGLFSAGYSFLVGTAVEGTRLAGRSLAAPAVMHLFAQTMVTIGGLFALDIDGIHDLF